MKQISVTLATVGTMLALGAAPTYAHDCFNPTKTPTAGVHYTITGFNSEGPVIEKTAQGNGSGGFVAQSPELTHAPETLYVHAIGHSTSHETVGGQSKKETHACNGRVSTTSKPAVQEAESDASSGPRAVAGGSPQRYGSGDWENLA